jgi:methylenetetrahydrofolate dehydrogenase (NADP+) / methenyltetrahydrofolate cyclohydrolase
VAAQVIDGRKIAAALREQVGEEPRAARASGRRVGLATVLVGDDPAAAAYVRRIDRTTAELGVARQRMVLPGTATQAEVIEAVTGLNGDPGVSGILVLCPLPTVLAAQNQP